MGSSSNRYAPRLPQQEAKSSTKLLAPTDPILGPENLLKTGFAQKGLPSSCVRISKNTLSGHQPTNPDPGSVSTTSVQNKQPPAPNASNQNNQSTQTGVKKFSSPKRTPTRHSAAKNLSVWRQACFIMAQKQDPKN